MEKYLFTGCSGFVAAHYFEFLSQNEKLIEIIGIDTRPPMRVPSNLSFIFEKIDLVDRASVNALIRKHKPQCIVHLASQSSVALSWTDPCGSFSNNTNAFLNLIEAVRKYIPEARVLSVGSSEQYGNVDESNLPISEFCELRPVSPYAVARCSQEWLSRVYVDSYGLDILMTRSFNHVGIYQSEQFFVSGIAHAFARAKRHGMKTCKLEVGDLEIVRDFVDVRDVIEGYNVILNNAERGSVFNICSGKGIRLYEIVEKIADISGIRPVIKTDQSRLRVSENRVVIGSNQSLREQLGWQPIIGLDQSLREITEYLVAKSNL